MSQTSCTHPRYLRQVAQAYEKTRHRYQFLLYENRTSVSVSGFPEITFDDGFENFTYLFIYFLYYMICSRHFSGYQG